jgi:hypothetical protein
MNKKALTVVLTGSALVFLAAGCSNPVSSTSSTGSGSSAQVQGASTGTVNGTGTPFGYGRRSSASSTRAGMGMPNLPAGSKPFFGTIASVSGSEFTISGRTRNSSSTISTVIEVSGSTQFQGGTQSSLAAGTRVVGYGTTNSDGSINAQSIQINPSFQGRPGGANAGTPPSSN